MNNTTLTPEQYKELPLNRFTAEWLCKIVSYGFGLAAAFWLIVAFLVAAPASPNDPPLMLTPVWSWIDALLGLSLLCVAFWFIFLIAYITFSVYNDARAWKEHPREDGAA